MAAKKPKVTSRKRVQGKRSVAAKTRVRARKAARNESPATDVPRLFRLNIEVGNLEQAEQFYSRLLAIEGRRQPGSRVYFEAGPVTLQVVDVSSTGTPHPAAKALYFAIRDLDALHERARALGALAKEPVHGQPGGEIAVRPWGERSFYAEDPWANPLCFVQADTTYVTSRG
jgi:predicted enzyme related to lactoylglutathione lyase